MVRVDVTDATNKLRGLYRDLDGRQFDTQVARALNYTAARAKTSVSQGVRAEYRIKAKDIKRAIVLRRAYVTKLEASIVAAGTSLPLRAFPHRQTRKGVSVAIMRGKRKVVQKAFVATMRSGHTGVFARGTYGGDGFKFRYKRISPPGKADTPITELRTTSVPKAMSRDAILEKVSDKIVATFPKRLSHLLGRASRYGKA